MLKKLSKILGSMSRMRPSGAAALEKVESAKNRDHADWRTVSGFSP
jgi:hypothetical protein